MGLRGERGIQGKSIEGPPGPQGLTGPPGRTGIPGTCEDSCNNSQIVDEIERYVYNFDRFDLGF